MKQFIAQIFKSFYNFIDRLLPTHVKLDFLAEINQLLSFFLVPFVYLVFKIIGVIWTAPWYCPVICVFCIYFWILFDSNAPYLFLWLNAKLINFSWFQRILYFLLKTESQLMVSNTNLFFLALLGVNVFIISLWGNWVFSILAFFVIWTGLFYYRLRLKYFNRTKLEQMYGFDYCIPDWVVLVNYLDTRFNTDFLQIKTRCSGNVSLKFVPIKNSLNIKSTRNFPFLGSRSMSLNPEIQKIGLEAFKSILKNSPEGVPLTLSLIALTAAITALAVSQREQAIQAREHSAREDAKLDLARERLKLDIRKQVFVEKQSEKALHDLLHPKKKVLTESEMIHMYLGPFLSKKEGSVIDTSKLDSILLNKLIPVSSSSAHKVVSKVVNDLD